VWRGDGEKLEWGGRVGGEEESRRELDGNGEGERGECGGGYKGTQICQSQ